MPTLAINTFGMAIIGSFIFMAINAVVSLTAINSLPYQRISMSYLSKGEQCFISPCFSLRAINALSIGTAICISVISNRNGYQCLFILRAINALFVVTTIYASVILMAINALLIVMAINALLIVMAIIYLPILRAINDLFINEMVIKAPGY